MSALHSTSQPPLIAAPDDTKYLDHEIALLYSPSESRLSSLPLLEICLNQWNLFMNRNQISTKSSNLKPIKGPVHITTFAES
ncbi:hypothetical protein Acr_20g0011890 [Actinidia rufa]|uniref:Uncharacterized protein n=1 Tax=Actinidia rufa TaxID=165716 RepID=A0A7J0GF39_9ERIC|nr:hypothetical protein Acr_20g0011890 [Actinidia rufa]